MIKDPVYTCNNYYRIPVEGVPSMVGKLVHVLIQVAAVAIAAYEAVLLKDAKQ